MKRQGTTTFAVKKVLLSCLATPARLVLRMATDHDSDSTIEYQSLFSEVSMTLKRREKTLNHTIRTDCHRPVRQFGAGWRRREAFDPAGIDPDSLPASLRR